MSAPIGIVHPFAASAVQSKVIGGFNVAIPATLEIIANLRLDICLTSVRSVAGERHELICRHSAEPWALRIDQRSRWASEPPSSSKLWVCGRRKLENRSNPPDPLVRVMRRKENRALHIGEAELFLRTWLVIYGQAWPREQIPFPVQRERQQRLKVQAISCVVTRTDAEAE